MVRLETSWINRSVPMIDAVFGPDRAAQYAAVTRLYNRSLGPVTRVNVLRPEVNDLPIWTSSCQHSAIGELLADLTIKHAIADAVMVPGGGKGIDLQAAFIGGLGEISERLLGVLHFAAVERRLVLASYDDMVHQGRRALGPHDIPLFASEQYTIPGFPYAPFHAATPLRWIDGVDLLTGEAVAVPAQRTRSAGCGRWGELAPEVVDGEPARGGDLLERDRSPLPRIYSLCR